MTKRTASAGLGHCFKVEEVLSFSNHYGNVCLNKLNKMQY